MSTKIHDGFLLKPGTNLFVFKTEFKQKYSEKLAARTRRSILKEMIAIYDRYQVKGFIHEVDGKPVDYTTPETAFTDLRSEMNSALQHVSYIVNSSEPWRVTSEKRLPHSISDFYSEQQGAVTVGQHQNGTLLGLMHAQHEYREVIESLEGFQEWLPYWDNTDRPKNLTKKQWSDREQLWEETFDLNKSAKSTGILLSGSEWYDSYMDLRWKNFTDEDWDDEEITAKRAEDICMEEWIEEKKEDKDLKYLMSHIMSIINDYWRVDHTERLNEIISELTPLDLKTVAGDWSTKA